MLHDTTRDIIALVGLALAILQSWLGIRALRAKASHHSSAQVRAQVATAVAPFPFFWAAVAAVITAAYIFLALEFGGGDLTVLFFASWIRNGAIVLALLSVDDWLQVNQSAGLRSYRLLAVGGPAAAIVAVVAGLIQGSIFSPWSARLLGFELYCLAAQTVFLTMGHFADRLGA